MVLILFDSYKQNISYDRAKLKKVGDFYALTWLIFAGLVTFLVKCIRLLVAFFFLFCAATTTQSELGSKCHFCPLPEPNSFASTLAVESLGVVIF